MPRRSEQHPAPDAFLCESCGYELAGLGEEGPCPECGAPVDQSLPTRRVGTPAQRSTRLAALWKTNFLILNPRNWAMVSVRASDGAQLWFHNALIASLIGGLSVWLPGPLAQGLERWLYASMFALAMLVLLLLLTVVEYMGLRFFGHQRRWRVTRAVAANVCAHASVAWIAAAILLGVGWHIGQRLTVNPIFTIPDPVTGGIAVSWAVLLPILGFFAGMLAFETLVYSGVRRLRFANHPGVRIEAPSPHLAPSESVA